MSREELESAITAKESEIEAKQKEIDNFEIDPDEHEEEYCEALDAQGDVVIGSLHYSPSHVLREIDLIAYRCGLNDFIDSLDASDDPKYKELEEELETLEDELADLKTELDELEEVGK